MINTWNMNDSYIKDLEHNADAMITDDKMIAPNITVHKNNDLNIDLIFCFLKICLIPWVPDDIVMTNPMDAIKVLTISVDVHFGLNWQKDISDN